MENTLKRKEKWIKFILHTLGIIPGVKSFSHQLDLAEVYEIGLHAYDQKDFTHAGEWMRTTLEMLGNETNVAGVEKHKVLDYLAFSEFKVIIIIMIMISKITYF